MKPGVKRFSFLRFLTLITFILYSCVVPLVHAAPPAQTAPAPQAANTNTKTPGQSAEDIYRTYRETNYVLWYDHGCGGSAGGSSAGGNSGGCGNPTNNDKDNEKQVWDYFVGQFQSKGYSQDEAQKAAAGIMGNWLQESGFNPDRHDGQGCDAAGAAFGIAQWCGGRIDKVKQYNRDHGKPENCLSGELEYTWSEMEQRGLADKMKGQDPGAAAATFRDVFEQARIDGGRAQKAQDEFAAMTGSGPSATTPGGTPSASAASASTSSSKGCKSSQDNGECKNPFRDLKNSKGLRFDAGLDFGGEGGEGPVYPACPATITYVGHDGEWPGVPGQYIAYQMTSGKAKGLFIYIAEDCTPAVKVGDTVTPDQPVCNYKQKSAYLETGWSEGGHDQYIKWTDYKCGTCSYASNSGLDIGHFLETLGTPKGDIQGGQSTTPPPPDWPKW